MPNALQLIDTLEVSNELGEGIIWDSQRQCVWWVDIQQCQLFRYQPKTKSLETWNTPERLCSFAPCEHTAAQDSHLVCAFESGFALYQPETGEVSWIKKLEQDNSGTRFNDGRTDRQGRFWAGTMVEDETKASYKGSLYRLDHDLSIRKTIEDLAITNSLCWSPDGTAMYHTDTPTQTIKRYAFDPDTAAIGRGEDWVFTHAGCFPDGSTVDAEGGVWNAQWGGSKVVRYALDGTTDLQIILPTSQPTCVAFGGTNLDLLFVTTAWSGMTEREVGAGHVYIYRSPIKGLPEARFKAQ